jgi:hypothetical protein
MMLGYDKSPAWLNDSFRRGMPIGSLEAERIAHHETGHVLLARVQHLPVHWVLGNIGFDEFGDGGRGHCCSVSPIRSPRTPTTLKSSSALWVSRC